MLNITRELICDLLDHRGRKDNSGIILTSDGWEVAAWTQHQPKHLIGILKGDAHDYVGADDSGEADEETLKALATEEDFRIPDETGDPTARPRDDSYVVVTGRYETWDIDYHFGIATRTPDDWTWRDAWWFDPSDATRVIEDETGESLWLTPGGRWVAKIRQHGSVHYSTVWVEVDRLYAIHAAYDSPGAVCDDPPPLIAAAVACHELAKAIRPGGRPWDLTAEDGARLVHDCAALSEFLRTAILAEIRHYRALGSQAVVDAHDGSVSSAAAALGLSPTTLSKLLKA